MKRQHTISGFDSDSDLDSEVVKASILSLDEVTLSEESDPSPSNDIMTS